jgi:hypothetical protein
MNRSCLAKQLVLLAAVFAGGCALPATVFSIDPSRGRDQARDQIVADQRLLERCEREMPAADARQVERCAVDQLIAIEVKEREARRRVLAAQLAREGGAR